MILIWPFQAWSIWGCRLHPRQKEVKILTGQNLTPPSAHKYRRIRWCWRPRSTPTTGASHPPSPSPSTSTQAQRCVPPTLITFIQFPLIKTTTFFTSVAGPDPRGFFFNWVTDPDPYSEYRSGYMCLILKTKQNQIWTYNIFRPF